MSISTKHSTHSDIIIVGAGPAGLAFARFFKGSELKITIIEKAPLTAIENPAYDGREIALTNTSKEILQNLGVWQRFATDEIYPLVDAKVYSGKLDYALHFQVPSLMKSMRSLDRLGNLISNHNIRKAVYDEVAAMDNVTLITDVGVTDVKTDDNSATVSLADGQVLTASLVIAADSRLSNVRRMLGIGADMHDFGRTVIVFRVTHPLSNSATAQECFLYGRTLALLPLNDTMTNCVITLDNTQADELLSLSPQALAHEAQRMFGDQFGAFTIAGSVHHYPLMGVHAHRFYAKRAALIGDAAVGMHPVTAHGYNLGLLSANTLAPLIIDAHRTGRDIGSERLLSTYNRRHQAHTRPLYHGTNAMVSLFTNDRKPVRILRDAALRLSNNLPPVKHWIAKQLVG
ncbi:5-demethoxyubiquinol-8 5-hydroxylase UbiM [Moraxella sp. FZFQ2102]|uniref:5-demethoxyubiquinol-8 5-hydroxylase UbiM n=1 Tax=Moraxella sp. FZFQ2102 TaxID=2953752 RepID=UPI00209C4AFB|nr:5-demethoxyubiquinol-8 5-hydroxylase UbiM [Moraxella sp. FZFQ2102]USZ14286.1 5-demethoxyubiquinol-8 5-hydroxylase UbiM [Moraxella sp. FZFQ2102]